MTTKLSQFTLAASALLASQSRDAGALFERQKTKPRARALGLLFAALAMLLSLILGPHFTPRADAASNDFNIDQKSDLVFTSHSDQVDLLVMNGLAVASRTTLINSPGWAVSHIADFNGDGKPDILFRHADGRVAMWLMNGVSFVSGAGLLEAGSGWLVSHVGDFNGDGKADILFRHTDGRVAMWLMNGTS